LFCNLGDHTEGTKLSFRPVARAVGNNTDIVQASVISNSDNNINTGGIGSTQGSGPINTEITAGFGLNIGKSVVSLPPEDESDYTPQYNPVGTLVPGSEEGRTIRWHIALGYNAGSEFVQDNGSGTQDFTITDTWVGTHRNADGSSDASVEGDNANGIFADGVKMLGDVTGDPLDNCSLLGAVAGSVTCDQPLGPGAPIRIQINGVQVNQNPLALVELNMFIPYDDVFDPNGFAQTEIYDVNNTAILTDWGGTGALVTSATDAEDLGPEIASEDFPVLASRTGPSNLFKSFSSVGNNKNGQRAGVKGEIIATSIAISDNRFFDTGIGICDTLDTNSFEFAGSIGAGQVDAFFDVPSFNTYALDENTTNGRINVHDRFNPKVIAYNNAQTPNDFDIAFISDGSNEGLTLEYSSVPYTVTGDNHFTATCQDELDGDPTTVDWRTDFTTFPNGAADVVRIRLVWQRDFSDLSAKLATVASLPLVGTQAIYSFDLRIKETVDTGTLLPKIGGESANTLLNVESTDGEALFSFNNSNADRVFVLSSSMSIQKNNNPLAQPPVEPGDTVSFTIDPATNGSNASAVTMTFTDTLPAQLSYLSNDCAAVYATVGLTCNVNVISARVVEFSVPGYQLGDDLPPFTIQATVNSGVPAGTYTNRVEISSDFADLTDDSHCDTAPDRFGNVTDASIEDCQDVFSSPHSDTASILVVTESGIRVSKADSVIAAEPLANYLTTLSYENLGGTDIGIGQLIEILPYKSPK